MNYVQGTEFLQINQKISGFRVSKRTQILRFTIARARDRHRDIFVVHFVEGTLSARNSSETGSAGEQPEEGMHRVKSRRNCEKERRMIKREDKTRWTWNPLGTFWSAQRKIAFGLHDTAERLQRQMDRAPYVSRTSRLFARSARNRIAAAHALARVLMARRRACNYRISGFMRQFNGSLAHCSLAVYEVCPVALLPLLLLQPYVIPFSRLRHRSERNKATICPRLLALPRTLPGPPRVCIPFDSRLNDDS